MVKPVYEASPVSAVWEITMGCNMRCKHCGSACADALADELTTEEALRLCDDLGELGFKWITLSGGEPTTRQDWPLIAKGLRDNGIKPNIITNCWTLDSEFLDKTVEAGINIIGISMDGMRETHDFMRRPGSFQRITDALDLMRDKGIDVMIITTVNELNLPELAAMREFLTDKGVRGWQLQIGFPMGSMADHTDLILKPPGMDTIIDFAYETMQEGKIEVVPSDCIGYYNLKEMEIIKSRCDGKYPWQGCTAGKYTLGILHNGDITGCTSIRDRKYIEGNIRNTPLREIWENPDSFSWNRQMKKDRLEGFCGKCRFGEKCLGGCANTKFTMGGSVHAENRYCSYNLAVKNSAKHFSNITSVEELKTKGQRLAESGYYQLAEIPLSLASNQPDGEKDVELLSLYGYVSFRLENYESALNANDKVLSIMPDNAYALNGKGLTLAKLGRTGEGIEFLKKATALADENYTDTYYDLAVVLMENDMRNDAISVLEEGRIKSTAFVEKSQRFYNELKSF